MSETTPIAGETLETQLRHYWRLLARRRWVVAGATAAVLAGVAVKTFRTTPTYRAVATIQIERADPNIMRFQEVMTYDPSYLSYQDYYQTQYKVLESRAVAQRTVKRLGLASEPDFALADVSGLVARFWGSLTRSLSRSPEKLSGAGSDPDQPYVDAVIGGLSIEPVRSSHLVSVGFVSRSPRLAALIANGIAKAYIDFGMETRIDTSENAGDFLAQQIGTLRKDVAQLEQEAQDYSESKEIIPTSGQGNTTLSALEDLQRAYTAAQADRAEKEAAYTSLRTTPDGAVPQVLSSPLIEDLTSQVAALEREQAELARKFKPGWPAVERVSSKLEQSRARLGEQTASMAASARSQAESAYRGATAREKNLEVLLDKQKHVALKLSTDSIEYTNLRSEISKKRETLDQLLKRQSEIALSSHLKDTRQSNIRIIDPARVPEQPYRPNVKLNLAAGLIAGLLFGLGLALGSEYLDSSIKSSEETRQLTGFAPIGVIPEHRTTGPRSLRRDSGPLDASADLITHLDPRSQLAEAYKELRTATLLASPDQPPRTILVTSCLPQEGKSQTSLNLAIALAQSGKRVLLIDTDLRRPRLHRALGLDNEMGISNYLSGNAPVERLLRETSVPNLFALTSGPIPPNPSELLGSRNFLALVQDFAELGRFDHLIFDSPPLLSVADPVVIATVLDGTILVVQSRKTPRDALIRGAAKLRQGNVKVLGTVLNNVSVNDRQDYYYRYATSDNRGEKRENRADTSA